jgi:hypothetical protein
MLCFHQQTVFNDSKTSFKTLYPSYGVIPTVKSKKTGFLTDKNGEIFEVIKKTGF